MQNEPAHSLEISQAKVRSVAPTCQEKVSQHRLCRVCAKLRPMNLPQDKIAGCKFLSFGMIFTCNVCSIFFYSLQLKPCQFCLSANPLPIPILWCTLSVAYCLLALIHFLFSDYTGIPSADDAITEVTVYHKQKKISRPTNNTWHVSETNRQEKCHGTVQCWLILHKKTLYWKNW